MRLPLACTVEYIDDFLSPEAASALYRELMEEYQLPQERLVIEAGGQRIATDSFKILFLIDELLEKNSHPKEIHGKNYAFRGQMAALKQQVEALLQREFDLAMCLYYPDGHYFAPYHSDQETAGRNTILPSVSLGEVREFTFKAKANGETYRLDLAHGSVLVMGQDCQSNYEHSLPKNPAYTGGRINITFRDRGFQ